MRHISLNEELFVESLDLLEDPSGLVERAHIVLVTRHYRHWHLFDILDGNISRNFMFLILRELWAILLEPVLCPILQQVEKGLLREELWSPLDVLLTPGHAKMGADHAPYFVPVLASQNVHAQNIRHGHYLFEESHGCLRMLDVHFGARSHQDHTTEVSHQLLLLLGEAIQHRVSSLVEAHVKHLVDVMIVLIEVVVFFQLLLDGLCHRWYIIHTDLSKRKVPVLSRISVDVESGMALAVTHTSVICEPDIVASLPKLNRKWEAIFVKFILEKPRIS